MNGSETAKTRTSDFATSTLYAPAPQDVKQIDLKDKYDLFIDGEFSTPRTGVYFDTINPANAERITAVAEAGAEDVDDAVRAAKGAYENTWSKISGDWMVMIMISSRPN